MSKKKRSLDQWIRPIGATLLLCFSLAGILLSFFTREINDSNRNSIYQLLHIATKMENWFYDGRTFHLHEQEKKSPHLVILEITDESLNHVGRWPWTRTVHAKILDHLSQYGAKVIMFDIAFPETESASADHSFALSIQHFVGSEKNRAVVLGYGITSNQSRSLDIPTELLVSSLNGKTGSTPMRGTSLVDKYNFVAPGLLDAGANLGFISADPDSDGYFRFYRLAFEQNASFFPSLALSGFANFYADGKDKKISIESEQGSEDYSLKISSPQQEYSLELNPKSETRIRFLGAEDAFTRVPIEEVIFDPAPEKNMHLKNIFQGKAVLIGSSAFAAHDLRNTPVDPQTPGMYLHANIFHALDTKYFYVPEVRSLLATLAIFCLGTLGVLLIGYIRHAIIAAIALVLLCIGIYSTDFYYFSPNGYFVRLFFCLLNAILLYAWFTILNVAREGKEKKKIREAFQRYVAPEIVQEMLADPEKLKVGGEKREITMIFSDVRNFTSISEKLPPQQLAKLLNIYMGRMTSILFSTHGTLDKYIGDALVGFWGAPTDIPDHAYLGVKGALLMIESLPAINAEFRELGFPEINIGIGLNTGEVSVGNMGSDMFFQYTALGDNMNLASRIESLTKYYQSNLLISEYTLYKLGNKLGEFTIRPIDRVQVKGRDAPVSLYEVLPSTSAWANNASMLKRYTEIYEQYFMKQHYADAGIQFSDLLKTMDDPQLHRLIAICSSASANSQNLHFTKFEHK